MGDGGLCFLTADFLFPGRALMLVSVAPQFSCVGRVEHVEGGPVSCMVSRYASSHAAFPPRYLCSVRREFVGGKTATHFYMSGWL